MVIQTLSTQQIHFNARIHVTYLRISRKASFQPVRCKTQPSLNAVSMQCSVRFVLAGYTWRPLLFVPASGTGLTTCQAVILNPALCLVHNNRGDHMVCVVCVSAPHQSTIDSLSVTPYCFSFKHYFHGSCACILKLTGVLLSIHSSPLLAEGVIF